VKNTTTFLLLILFSFSCAKESPEEQIKELENESTPETKILVDDTMAQLTKLEINYKKLEQDLINGGNSKLILSAMITNFQTRIDLLQEVMDKIENIKTFKNYDDENITI